MGGGPRILWPQEFLLTTGEVQGYGDGPIWPPDWQIPWIPLAASFPDKNRFLAGYKLGKFGASFFNVDCLLLRISCILLILGCDSLLGPSLPVIPLVIWSELPFFLSGPNLRIPFLDRILSLLTSRVQLLTGWPSKLWQRC